VFAGIITLNSWLISVWPLDVRADGSTFKLMLSLSLISRFISRVSLASAWML